MKPTHYLPKIIGTHLQYHEAGEGPTLLLVPGLDGTALLFYRQVPLLEKHFHVVTFPLPNDPHCSMDSLVDLLREVIEKIIQHRGTEKVFLCGESFGGALSLSFALAHPEVLKGLVIVNSFPKIRSRWQLQLGPLLLKLIPWGAMAFVRRFTEFKLHSPHARAEDLNEFHQRMRHVGRQGYIRRLEILKDYNIEDRLGEIKTPTLFLAGDLDRLLPSVKEAQIMASRMPRATMKVLKNYGHICMINHDFNLLDYMMSWLGEERVSF